MPSTIRVVPRWDFWLHWAWMPIHLIIQLARNLYQLFRTGINCLRDPERRFRVRNSRCSVGQYSVSLPSCQFALFDHYPCKCSKLNATFPVPEIIFLELIWFVF
jgi:hypothetical protein